MYSNHNAPTIGIYLPVHYIIKTMHQLIRTLDPLRLPTSTTPSRPNHGSPSTSRITRLPGQIVLGTVRGLDSGEERFQRATEGSIVKVRGQSFMRQLLLFSPSVALGEGY